MKIRMYVPIYPHTLMGAVYPERLEARMTLIPSPEEIHKDGGRIVSFEVDIPDEVFDFGDVTAEVSDVKVEE